MRKPCGGRLAYEVAGGARVFREDARGRRRFRWRCEACGATGEGNGEARIHNALPCVVCAERPRVGMLFCAPCSRSWDRDAERDTTFAAAVVWAAERARRFERRRARRAK